eukprot:5488920-Pyramimonas_sp.AAC.1
MSARLAEQVADIGNPRACWTYPDEAENRLMQRVAKSLMEVQCSTSGCLRRFFPDRAAWRTGVGPSLKDGILRPLQ